MKMLKRVLFLCGMGVAAASPGEQLGRLFFTPEERLLLEQQREGGSSASPDARIRLDGRAARQNGNTTQWINGRVERDRRIAGTAALRVGESLDPLTGTKHDLVPDGSIVRTR
jgi:hypothetical protein